METITKTPIVPLITLKRSHVPPDTVRAGSSSLLRGMRTRLLFLSIAGLLQIHAGCCQQQECRVALNDPTYAKCAYWGNALENSGRPIINFGDSIGLGGTCLITSGGEPIRCGYIEELEQRLGGTGIANFSRAAHTAVGEVDSGFSIVGESRIVNPDAKRVYVHIGINDLRNYMEQDCSRFPLAFDPNTRTCRWASEEMRIAFFEQLETVTWNVRAIVREYQRLGIREVVVGSFHPVEQNGNYFASCRNTVCPGTDNFLCLNELIESFSIELEDMVTSLGGPNAGVYFADHFHGFPATDPGSCGITCDCAHLNCYGHEVMAQTWYEALPSVPDRNPSS